MDIKETTIDSRLSIREQFENMRRQSELSNSSLSSTLGSQLMKKSVEKTLSTSPKSESSNSAAVSATFKKRKDKDRYTFILFPLIGII